MVDSEAIQTTPGRLTMSALPLVDEHHQEDDEEHLSSKSQSDSVRRNDGKKRDFRPTLMLLKYKLKSLNISFQQLDEYLFSKLPTQDGTITSDDLIY